MHPSSESQQGDRTPRQDWSLEGAVISAQRNYTANSRVFQTGSELMDVLVNLS